MRRQRAARAGSMNVTSGETAVGTVREIVTEYSLAIDQLCNDGALQVKNPDEWWRERRRLDNWLVNRLQFGYVAKTAEQLAHTAPSSDAGGRNRLRGGTQQRPKHA